MAIEGVDLRDVDAGWYRRQIGVVSQDPHLFSDTVAANIAYGLDDVSQEDVEAAAKMANAHSFILDLPAAYQTPVNDKCALTLAQGTTNTICPTRLYLEISLGHTRARFLLYRICLPRSLRHASKCSQLCMIESIA